MKQWYKSKGWWFLILLGIQIIISILTNFDSLYEFASKYNWYFFMYILLPYVIIWLTFDTIKAIIKKRKE